MKLLVISPMYPNPIEPFSGIFVHQQLKELSKSCEVKVVSPISWAPKILWFRKKWRRYGRCPVSDVLDGIEVFYPRMLYFPRSALFQWYGYSLYGAIKKTVEQIEKSFKFDLIHCHVALPDGFGGMLVNRRLHRKLVVSIHGQDVTRTVFRNKRCKAAIERVFAHADAIITVSTKLAKMSSDYCNETSKIRTINDGIYLQDVMQPDPHLRARYRGEKILLAAGSLIESKGYDLLLKAVARIIPQIRNLRVLIIGTGREEQNLKQGARRLGLEAYVSFLGPMPHEEVMRFMAVCDVFVLPSWNEGFGIVYLEAMANGKPTIACKGEGIEDVIVDGQTGILVEPRDVASLEHAILKLLSDEQYLHAMGDAARKQAENYSWEIIAKQTFDLYREVLGSDRRV